MSELDAFLDAALSESLDVMGRVPCTIGGSIYHGLVNEFIAQREMELGGFVGSFDATVIFERRVFAVAPDSTLERDLEGKQLTIQGRTFRIARAAADETSATLGLVHIK